MIFPHLAGYTVDCFVDGRVHVVRFRTGLNGDMPVTAQNGVHPVTMFFET